MAGKPDITREGESSAKVAARAVRSRLREVSRGAERVCNAARKSDAGKSAKAVHALRVSCRRAEAVLAVLGKHVPEASRSRIEKTLRSLRKRAGEVRNADVHEGLLLALRDASPSVHDAVDVALASLRRDRKVAWGRLHKRVKERALDRLELEAKHIGGAVRGSAATLPAPATLRASALRPLVVQTLEILEASVRDPQELHSLRVLFKRIRYTAGEFAGPSADGTGDGTGTFLAEAQRRLGEVNDIATLCVRLGAIEVDGLHDAGMTTEIARVRERFEAVGTHRLTACGDWLLVQDAATKLRMLLPGPDGVTTAAPPEESGVDPVGADAPSKGQFHAAISRNGHHAAAASFFSANEQLEEESLSDASQQNLWLAGKRLAVIDVGSNGIRMLGVELADERNWTVLAEERATARLAEGMGRDKGLCTQAMGRAVEAIQRFKVRAERLGCTVRAFATAAVRDASNRADFVSLVKDRTGLDLCIISALEEGKYTYAAVARRHDLSHGLCAVVDIGGGSLEVVFSLDGVIMQNTSMPLGAVRLTEAFGGAEEVGRDRFDELRRHVARELAWHVPRPDSAPAVVVGCGGTFTTMLTLGAAMRGVLIERNSPALRTLGPMTRPQLREIIDRLRRMSLAERLRVPGLPADRADIVVAGLVVVERLMKHLGVSQIHANPGGVREGLMLRMIGEETRERAASQGDADTTSDDRLLADARDLSHRCRAEADHGEQVATLAIKLYDSLIWAGAVVPRLGTAPHERALLQAAGIVHDVGIMVEYRRHHRHSATIIRHADMPAWSPQQQELLAQVCRYHRRGVPTGRHTAFADLHAKDKELVRRLAAILRVADGLDRSHAMAVTAVRVRVDGPTLHIEAASEGDATTEIRAATQKADLLEAVTAREVAVVAQRGAPVPGTRAARHPSVAIAT